MKIVRTLSCALLVLGVAAATGCETPSSRGKPMHTAVPGPSGVLGTMEPAATPVRSDRWPQTRRADGANWHARAYPTGDPRTSVIGLEFGTPTEVRLNSPFESTLVVTNLSSRQLNNVTVIDRPEQGFVYASASPEGRVASDGTIAWTIGTLEPRETKEIRLVAKASREGTIGSCATVSYDAYTCATIDVVQPQLRITHAAPAEAILCDDIPFRITVQNTGTGTVEGAIVKAPLPAGLATADGRREISVDVDRLAPGQSREFTVNVRAASKGQYASKMNVQDGSGLAAESAVVVTNIRQPILKIERSGPVRQFLGRDTTYELKVTNVGDGAARETVLDSQLTGGGMFVRATEGGRVSTRGVRWQLGTLAPGATKTVAVTIGSDSPGTLRIRATASAKCADAVTAAGEVAYQGIPAILLEVLDEMDPVAVGGETVYVITATNQGSANGTNIRILCTLEDAVRFVSAKGATSGSSSGAGVTFAPLPSLAPGQQATWRVRVKAAKTGDSRFTVQMTSDQLQRPVQENEATNIYE